MSATDSLPWNDLKLTDNAIPWGSLRALADAAAARADVRQRLVDEMRRHLDRRFAAEPAAFEEFTDLAVPAVFAMAAEKLDLEGRQDAARFLLDLLYTAGEYDDDWLLEVLQDSACRFGAAAALPALELVERHGSKAECWFHLCSVLRTAALKAPDDVRQRVIEVCRKVVATAPDRYEQWSTVDAPARVLAGLRDMDSLPLLEEIEGKSQSGEMADIIAEMKSAANAAEWDLVSPRLKPIEEWLPNELRRVREYVESQENEVDASDDIGPDEIDADEKYGKLLKEFVRSSAFAKLPESVRCNAEFAAWQFLHFAWEYLGTPLEKLNGSDIEEILTNYFPRKISGDDEFYEAVPGALCAFLRWAGETTQELAVSQLCIAVTRCADRMTRKARDPANWGMAKSFAMMAQKEGVDLSDPAEREAFMLRYNQRLQSAGPRPRHEDERPAPARRVDERVGRNDPCPCGSGRKYKKCCLRNG